MPVPEEWYWNKVVINLPSYGRATTKLPKMLKSAFETVSDPNNIELVLIHNPIKDPDTISVANQLCGEYGVVLTSVVENMARPHLSLYFNMAYKQQDQDPRRAQGYYGDDMLFCTPGWDERVLWAIAKKEGIGVFYCAGDDRFGDALCVNMVLTRKFVRMCSNWFMCPKFPANGSDMVWQLAADATNLDMYIDDVVILHEQCSRAHLGWDETYHRLFPARRQAIRDKMYEKSYAQKLVQRLNVHGFGDGRKAVHNLHRVRPGRHYISMENGERIVQGDGNLKVVDEVVHG